MLVFEAWIVPLFAIYSYITASVLTILVLYSIRLAHIAEEKRLTILHWQKHFNDNVSGSWIFYDGAGH